MTERNDRADGYRGIWFRLGQIKGEYGDKYAGGLGTYTMKHVPMAAYAPAVDRTFFTYGATPADATDLRIAVGSYDHGAHRVSRPTIVDPKSESNPAYDSETVVDPHDNAALCLDPAGRVWVFVAGRGRRRPGRVFRSVSPYAIESFERVAEFDHFAYPQPWWLPDGLLVCFTIYDESSQRELYWRRLREGEWISPAKFAGIGGHYGVSERLEEGVVTAFNYHPDGDVDRRTNLYVMRFDGEAWSTVDGRRVDVPVTAVDSEALVVDYRSRDRLVYLNDVAVDEAGNPAVLYLTSDHHAPGPEGDPRRWRLTRWDGEAWQTSTVTRSDHNYDSGSLYRRDGEWVVVGPTEPGPRPYHTGGRMAVWRSADGENWTRTHRFPGRAGYGATYARRPRDATPPFEAFWADGDPGERSDSRLFFGSLSGECFRLPAEIGGETAEPTRVE